MNAKPAPTEISIFTNCSPAAGARARFRSSLSIARSCIAYLKRRAGRRRRTINNLQPWRFIVFDRQRDEAAFARVRHAGTGQQNVERERACADLRDGVHAHAEGRCQQDAAYDTGAAAMALVLQAHASGLATHRMGGFDRDPFRQAFAIPEDMQIIAMVAIGHHGDAS